MVMVMVTQTTEIRPDRERASSQSVQAGPVLMLI